jgi:hypothetical protein
MLRVFAVYKPFKAFMGIGSLLFAGGFALGVRWLILFFIYHTPRTHVPSLILASILIILGVIIVMLAILGDLMAVNRKILEELQYKMRKMEIEKSADNE